MINEVASPIDLRCLDDAREWESTAMSKRPWRVEFFQAFEQILTSISVENPIRLLELGAGPGFLAEHLLKNVTFKEYVALDFSPAMHQLAAKRLGVLSERVSFITRSFKDAQWADDLGTFDVVVTLQAVHELRHKSYATGLHAQVRKCLVAGGSYLVCDHFSGPQGMHNNELYMSIEEQKQALEAAGFNPVKQVLVKGTLVLHHAI